MTVIERLSILDLFSKCDQSIKSGEKERVRGILKSVRLAEETIAQIIEEEIKGLRPDNSLKNLWQKITETDKFINEKEPWNKEGESLKKILDQAVSDIRIIVYNLKPFLPETAEKIEKQFKGPKIKSESPLFPRL